MDFGWNGVVEIYINVYSANVLIQVENIHFLIYQVRTSSKWQVEKAAQWLLGSESPLLLRLRKFLMDRHGSIRKEEERWKAKLNLKERKKEHTV